MKATDSSAAPRQTADERRDAILDAAITEFAVYGLHGTSTKTIARRVGISQPYIFRLFDTKKALFLAALERVYDRITAIFLAAAAPAGADVLESMGRSYMTLLARREELFLLLQAFAGSSDHEIQRVAHDRYAALYRTVATASGADEKALRQFFAYGIHCTVAAAIDLPLLMGHGKKERRRSGTRPSPPTHSTVIASPC